MSFATTISYELAAIRADENRKGIHGRAPRDWQLEEDAKDSFNARASSWLRLNCWLAKRLHCSKKEAS